MDNKIEMYKEMVLKGEKLEKEQAMELLTVKPFVIINLICVQSLMERAGDVRRIVNIVRRQPAIRQKWKTIHFFPRKRFWKMRKR